MFKKQNAVSVLDIPDFVQLLTDVMYNQEDHCKRVHSACERMEDFLSKAGTEIREMIAIEMFERLQNVGYPSGSDSFAQFLGPEMKRLWAETPSHLEKVHHAGFAGSFGPGSGSIDFADRSAASV
jgi:hypothetical protein